MHLKDSNFWQWRLRRPGGGPASQAETGPPPVTGANLPRTVDCVIVGGGITGLVAARALRLQGVTVALFEAETLGWGASSRNAGMALTGLKRGLADMIARYGRETAHRLFRASVESVDAIEQLVVEERIDCDFQRHGHLTAAFKPAHYEMLKRKAETLRVELGYETRLVPPADLADELRTSYYHGGLVDEHSAGLDPARYTAGLAAAAARRGALLFERTTVLDLQRSGPEFSVHTSQGALRSGAVLVASNGYTGYHAPGLDPWLRRRIVPIGSHILATERLDAALATRLIPRGRMVFDTKNMLFYFRRSPDNRILFGGRATFTPTSLETTSRILRQGMLAVFPELAQARIEHIWGGRVGFTFDLEPQLGVHDGIHYALGYCGHGVALGTLLGGSVARLIAGLPEDSPFLTLPFPSNPAYRGRPWFLPLAGAWFRVLDLAR